VFRFPHIEEPVISARAKLRSWRAHSIGGKIVPEMFEVDALTAGDQRQRRFAEEVEVPEVVQQKDVIPFANAREEQRRRRVVTTPAAME
jgi:hypothetical protein